MEQYKTCTSCHATLNLELFYKEKLGYLGRRSKCIACFRKADKIYRQKNAAKESERKKQWREQNRDLHANRKKQWRKNNSSASRQQKLRRRARQRSNGIYFILPKEMRRLLASECFYCGMSASQIDHILPVSRGGGHRIGNLVAACPTCNASKRERTIMEWKKVRGW